MIRTKLKRLELMKRTLAECMRACVEDVNERRLYHSMMEQVMHSIQQEQHRLGYKAVYLIANGMATDEALYEGSAVNCTTYVRNLLKALPEMQDKIIQVDI